MSRPEMDDHLPVHEESLQILQSELEQARSSEAAHQANEVMYQSFLDNFQGVAYRGDFSTKPDFVRGSTEQLCGYSVSEILSMHWDDLIHPEDKAQFYELNRIGRANPGVPTEREYRIISKDGSVRWIHQSQWYDLDSSGNPTAAEGVAYDITEQKELQLSLLKSERLLTTVLDATPAAITVQRPDHTIIAANALRGQIQGLPREQLVGSKCYAFADRTSPCDNCAVESAIRTKTTETLEQSFSSRGKAYDQIVVPVLNDDGEVEIIVGIFRDVTERKLAEERAKAERDFVLGLFDSMPQYVTLTSQDYLIEFTNRSMRDWLGNRVGEICYQVMGRAEPCPECPVTGLRRSEAGPWTYRLTAAGRTLEGSSSKYVQPDGKVSLLSTLTDVTEREATNQRLGYYQLLASRSRDIVVMAGLDGQILEANEAATEEFGYSREELLGLRVQDFRLADAALVDGQIQQAATSGILFETVHRRKDGTTFPVEVSSQGADLNGRRVVVSICTDISARKAAQDKMLHMSFHDKLTGLYNRSYLDDLVDQGRLDNVYPVSLILGDMNGLKLTNDAFGHAVGDCLIQAVAKAMRNCTRTADIPVRWGGDEFLIVLPYASNKDAELVCDQIRAEYGKVSEGLPIAPSVAWGIASSSDSSPKFPVLIRQAEDRMYRNKLSEEKGIRSAIITSLRAALSEKSFETDEHAERMRDLAVQLGKELGLSDSELDDISLLAALHDIGKVAISDEILVKPDKLSPEEWQVMRRHPEIGYWIANTVPEMVQVAEVILCHHERWDGRGYPRTLAGKDIPLLARIIAVVDSYDVMVNGRPYQPAKSQNEAIEELIRCSGSQFDPEIVSVVVQMMAEQPKMV